MGVTFFVTECNRESIYDFLIRLVLFPLLFFSPPSPPSAMSALRSSTKFINTLPSAALSARGTAPASKGLAFNLIPHHDVHGEFDPMHRAGKPAGFALKLGRNGVRSGINGEAISPLLTSADQTWKKKCGRGDVYGRRE